MLGETDLPWKPQSLSGCPRGHLRGQAGSPQTRCWPGACTSGRTSGKGSPAGGARQWVFPSQKGKERAQGFQWATPRGRRRRQGADARTWGGARARSLGRPQQGDGDKQGGRLWPVGPTTRPKPAQSPKVRPSLSGLGRRWGLPEPGWAQSQSARDQKRREIDPC